ncbi:MAG: GPR endopeptidase, partial [Clostridia bacterium]|nr:GPR endopeptidase [Clostridia bacterium]
KDHDAKLYASLGGRSVCAIAPGVIGQTGIESLELIRGAAIKVRPQAVIVIDALAAVELSHLATTVQITDTGIAPGSGIGNRRMRIDKESLGCPVIAIGVPTVVESSTLVYAALEEAGITDIDESLRTVLENGRGFFVTPKESDVVTTEVSRLLSEAINLALS